MKKIEQFGQLGVEPILTKSNLTWNEKDKMVQLC